MAVVTSPRAISVCHFGLGLAEKIAWPSGQVETFKNLAADRFYALVESEGFWRNGDVTPVGDPLAKTVYLKA